MVTGFVAQGVGIQTPIVAMLNPLPVQVEREDLFVERYNHLLDWSMQMTEHDRELAEDLLHDLFIQFMLNAPDLHQIKNLDGYLYTMLRNLYLTQRRRDTRNTLQQLSIVEYDSAEVGLRTVDLRDQIRAQDDLRRICQYACARKETAKIGSVLILRFFHGYYLEEIVRVLRTSRTLVDTWLKLARREIRTQLLEETEKTNRLAFIHRNRVTEVLPTGYARNVDLFVEELREAIFQHRHGACLTNESLKQLYSAENVTAVECSQLAHIVSCRQCLDLANRLLGLPLLAARSATETLGRDTRKPGGGDDGGGGTGGGGLSRLALNKLRRRVKDAFEHKPLELCVSVNGYTLGSQRVSSERSELNLVVDQDVRVSFVEVFSEQKIRLLVMGVEELPPDGPGEQSTQVELSDQRLLDLTLRLASPSPTIQVVYSDPHFNEAPDTSAALDGISIGPDHEHSPSPTISSLVEGASAQKSINPIPASGSDGQSTRAWRQLLDLRKVYRALGSWSLWLRPATVTTLFAFVLIAALLWMNRPVPTPGVSAVNLLQQSVKAEQALAAQNDLVIHRTVDLEERGSDGQAIARRKVVVWESGERGLAARRLYDDQGKLIAGIWTRRDGVQTFYQHGTQPKVQAVPHRRELNALGVDYLWQVSLAAEEFSALVGDMARAQVEQKPDTYVIHYEPPANSTGLVRASLVLSRADLHAVEQTLTIQVGGETREYRYVEVGFERRTPASVAPQVFDPDPALIANDKTGIKLGESSTVASPLFPSPVVATAALEVEVLQLLNNAGSDSSDQVNVTRTPEGRLRVDGIVETAARKSEILRALEPVSKHPAVQITVETIDEASRREARNPFGPVQLSRVEVLKTALPVEPDLRRYFSRQGSSEEQIQEVMRQFANRVTNHALQARFYARTLKQTLSRFSQDDLRTLDPQARGKLMSLLRAQAVNVERATQALRRDLEAVFPVAAASTGAEKEIATESDLVAAVNRL
ncbi:MAG TPA: RNA polymerase sigma factor, partial [Pyrinomonadaceae bacterium]|nr:RNA polymerase sigma factor [Pyrinomonadaceae bacterium]